MSPLQAAVFVVMGFLAAAQEAPDRSSPFTGVKWDGDKPLVEFEGEWYEFVSLDGATSAQIVDFCKKEYERRWKKRFSEDLVDVLRKMAKAPKATAALVLSKDGKTLEKTGTFTTEHRRKAAQYNEDHPQETEPGPREPGRPAPARPPAAPRVPYDFESARIVFKYSGQFDGTETLHVAESGKTLVLEMDKKIAVRERKTVIWKDGKCTVIDHDTRKAHLQSIKPADIDLSVRHATDEGLKQVGLLRKGTETVAGKECVLYEKLNGEQVWRSWRWKGIELKIEMKNILKLNYVKEAVSVEEGTVIPEALLNVPDGYAK